MVMAAKGLEIRNWIPKPVAATLVVAASDSLHPERADYICLGANDQVVIQQAIDALPAAGGSIQLLDGTFYIGAGIVIDKPGVAIRGVGVGEYSADPSTRALGTCLRATAGGYGIFEIGTTGGNHVNMITLEHMFIWGDNIGHYGIRIVDVVDLQLSDLVLRNCIAYEIYGAPGGVNDWCAGIYANKVIVTTIFLVPPTTGQGTLWACYFDECWISLFQIGDATHVWSNVEDIRLDNCSIIRTLIAYGLTFETRQTLTVSNTTFFGTTDEHRIFLSAVRNAVFGDISVFSQNTADAAFDGIHLIGCDNVVIDGFRIRSSVTANVAALRYGVYADTCDHVIISNGVIENCSLAGIYVTGCTYCNVEGNILQNVGQTAAGIRYGIYIGGLGGNHIISGNTLEETAVNKCRDGIYLYQADNCRVIGNHVTGTLSGIYLSHSATLNTITANVIIGITNNGIYLTGASGPCYRNVISSNIIISPAQNGIYIYACDELSIVGNFIVGTGAGSYSAISLSSSHRCTVTGNELIDFGTHGIYFYRSGHGTITGNVCYSNGADGIRIDGTGGLADYNEITGNSCVSNVAYGIHIFGDANVNGNRVINNKLTANGTAPFNDAGTNTMLAAYVVPFSHGSDPQDSGYEIDVAGEFARAWLRLPVEVQQVVRMNVYARSVVAEVHEMELEMVVNGGADNEAFNTHVGSIAQLDSVSVNFAADDIIFWINTEAGTLALVGGDSVEVKVLHEAAEVDNCATDAFFRTVEIEYV